MNPSLHLRPIYLDGHATTPVDPRVRDAMWPWFSEKFGNAASTSHLFGWEAAEAVERAREQVAGLFQADPKSVVFTSGATEANNLAIKGVLHAAPAGSGLITTVVEHRAVLDPAKRLARQGYELVNVPVDSFGQVDPQRFADSITPRTRLASVMLANNEVGTIQPIEALGAICRDRGIWLHCDATQGIGRVPIDWAREPIDLLSLSGHKIYGPKGIGLLLVRRDRKRIPMEPMLDGGGHEQRLRSGTLPVPLIVGLGVACELAGKSLEEETNRVAALRDRLWRGISIRLEGVVRNGHPTATLPGNLHVSFEGVRGEVLLARMKEIAVSSGSACTSADPEPSHVLRARGVPEALANASLRFGLGRFNTEAEIDFASDYVVEIVRKLRIGIDIH
ncbi:MAG: cysteine desulfurase family protein [Planctomycetota bacterium]|nr:cysteine desulfurase family protein [Planctomycetota bacterium]